MARMNRLLGTICLGIAVTAAVGAATAVVEFAPVHKAPAHRAETDNGRVIVKFRERASVLSASRASVASSTRTAAGDSGPQSAGVLGTRLGLALADGRVLGPRTQVMTATGMTSSELARSIASDADVEWAEVDHRRFVQVVPDDPLYADRQPAATPTVGQWYLRAPGVDSLGNNVLSGINIEPAWGITTGSSTIVIADVDTGITSHPDLNSKLLLGYDFITDVPIANDGGGRDNSPADPGDWITAAENSQITGGKKGPFWGCADDDVGDAKSENSTWHGTQTAGILGASSSNGLGMAGVAWNSPLVAVRALGKCGGYDSDIIAGANWSAGLSSQSGVVNANPARVINMSLGSQGECGSPYRDALTALRNHKVFVVAAAGNDEGLPVAVPANCKPAAGDPDQTPIVIAVAGVRHVGTKVSFSDIGPEVTLSAPGGNCVNTDESQPCLYPILTTSNTGDTGPVAATYTNSFGAVSLGTSFSAPLVSGTVALMLAANPKLTNAQVISLLKSTARPFPTTSDTVPAPPVCTVPTAAVKDANGNVITPASPVQKECICTTATCGAGMLDAGAAVGAAFAIASSPGTPPVAVISPAAPTVAVTHTVTLSGDASTVGSSGAPLSYQWSLPDSNTNVGLGSATGATVVVTGAAVGSARVQLTVTDTNGLTATSTVSVTVTAAPSSSDGGGAANPAWLLALAIAGALLGPRRRRAGG